MAQLSTFHKHGLKYCQIISLASWSELIIRVHFVNRKASGGLGHSQVYNRVLLFWNVTPGLKRKEIVIYVAVEECTCCLQKLKPDATGLFFFFYNYFLCLCGMFIAELTDDAGP